MIIFSLLPKKTFFYLSFFFILLVTACTPSKKTTSSTSTSNTTDEVSTESDNKPTRVAFNGNADLSAALAKAKNENKVVFIDFYTTWCFPCKMMDQGAFRDWDVADYMTLNCVALKVDAEKGDGKSLSSQFNVGAYPTLVFLAPSGNELARQEGSLGIEDFKVFMKASVWKFIGK